MACDEADSTGVWGAAGVVGVAESAVVMQGKQRWTGHCSGMVRCRVVQLVFAQRCSSLWLKNVVSEIDNKKTVLVFIYVCRCRLV